MAQVQALAAGTAAADSADIVVVAGTPVNVGLNRPAGTDKNAQATMRLYRKDIEGEYLATGEVLTIEIPNRLLVGAGTYMVRRTETTVATGVITD